MYNLKQKWSMYTLLRLLEIAFETALEIALEPALTPALETMSEIIALAPATETIKWERVNVSDTKTCQVKFDDQVCQVLQYTCTSTLAVQELPETVPMCLGA